jgi:hypothetical protein
MVMIERLYICIYYASSYYRKASVTNRDILHGKKLKKSENSWMKHLQKTGNQIERLNQTNH